MHHLYTIFAKSLNIFKQLWWEILLFIDPTIQVIVGRLQYELVELGCRQLSAFYLVALVGSRDST